MNANLKSLSEKFKTLLEHLEQERPGFLDAAGEGYPLEAIRAEFSGRKLPDGLIAIYLNVGNIGNILTYPVGSYDLSSFIPGYDFVDLTQINRQIKIYEEICQSVLIECSEVEYLEYDYWEPDMIPFLGDGCGCFYCIRSLTEDQSIHHIDKVEGRSYVCRDFAIFIDMISKLYEERVYFVNKDGELDCEWELLEQIESKYSS